MAKFGESVQAYNAWLKERARAVKPGEVVAFINFACLPWFIPTALAIAICWAFDIEGRNSYFVTVPLLGITFIGIAWICGVIIGEMVRRARDKA